ncbi:hypothetical protein QBK93_30870 [Rhizobium leguminosarum]|uniref:hypothetical protein n=1 Tax=Rhizobium leguminosarum TaxID=384 RepID=UPI0024A7F00A|nr:hypothetical protein [Rhizobium leguminosarum]MDI5929050.1 hypothetical protein [Rhizobium leguminosarum]
MTFLVPSSPTELNETLVAGLKNFRVPRDGGTVEATNPIPVYSVDLKCAESWDIPGSPTGWRFILDVNGETMLADIDVEDDENASLHFNSIAKGRFAERFKEAWLAANEFSSNDEDKFALRVIEVPALYDVGLWLHGQVSDWMFHALRRGHAPDLSAVKMADYVNDMSNAAISKSAEDDASPSPSGNDQDGQGPDLKK